MNNAVLKAIKKDDVDRMAKLLKQPINISYESASVTCVALVTCKAVACRKYIKDNYSIYNGFIVCSETKLLTDATDIYLDTNDENTIVALLGLMIATGCAPIINSSMFTIILANSWLNAMHLLLQLNPPKTVINDVYQAAIMTNNHIMFNELYSYAYMDEDCAQAHEKLIERVILFNADRVLDLLHNKGEVGDIINSELLMRTYLSENTLISLAHSIKDVTIDCLKKLLAYAMVHSYYYACEQINRMIIGHRS